MAGWNEYIKEFKNQTVFWHALWKSSGEPRFGVVADMRRCSRAKYHQKGMKMLLGLIEWLKHYLRTEVKICGKK